jgi:spermidine synthase
VYARDGLTSSIFVAWQPDSDNLYLAVNGKTDASSREDLETQIMAGHVPLLFHPAPRDVAIIGLASGITVGAVATHPVERIRVIEVEGAMIEAARRFARYNHDVLEDPRLSVSINDARNELQFNPADYDVIISEPSNPWLTVAANLFTEEFFRVGRSRLRPGGVFGQWIQTYCLTPDSVRSILAAFHRVYPHVIVFGMTSGVDLLVVGSDRPLILDVDAFENRTSALWIRADLARAGVRSAVSMAAMIQTGGDAIGALVEGATVNSDDNGLVEFSAPQALFLDTQDANTAMLQGTTGDPLGALTPLVRTSQDPGLFRLELIRRWVRWEEKPRAERAAAGLETPDLRAQAQALLENPK